MLSFNTNIHVRACICCMFYMHSILQQTGIKTWICIGHSLHQLLMNLCCLHFFFLFHWSIFSFTSFTDFLFIVILWCNFISMVTENGLEKIQSRVKELLIFILIMMRVHKLQSNFIEVSLSSLIIIWNYVFSGWVFHILSWSMGETFIRFQRKWEKCNAAEDTTREVPSRKYE